MPILFSDVVFNFTLMKFSTGSKLVEVRNKVSMIVERVPIVIIFKRFVLTRLTHVERIPKTLPGEIGK